MNNRFQDTRGARAALTNALARVKQDAIDQAVLHRKQLADEPSNRIHHEANIEAALVVARYCQSRMGQISPD